MSMLIVEGVPAFMGTFSKSISKFPTLSEGDLVDVIAPSSAPEEHLLPAIESFLNDWNLRMRCPANLIGRHPLYAHDDEVRASHLINALYAEDSKAVWCLRGGYGSARLIPYLRTIKAAPDTNKLFIGFSDITSLHLYLNTYYDMPTLHGPCAQQLVNDDISKRSIVQLEEIVFGRKDTIIYKGLIPLNDPAKEPRTVQSKIFGGSMYVLNLSLGTYWSHIPKDVILFLEDVGESAHRIDGMLTHLTQAGVIDRLKAIIFGDFTEVAKRETVPDHYERVLKVFASKQTIPVVQIKGIGHGRHNAPLPLNTNASLLLGNKYAELQISITE